LLGFLFCLPIGGTTLLTRRLIATVLYLALSVFGISLYAQQEEHAEPPAEKAAKPAAGEAGKPGEAPKEKPAGIKDEPPVVTHHQITVGGRVLKYTATTGYMPLRNPETDEVEANIFFMAYTLDNPGAKRPLMFSFNGGPGSASVWLHLGAIGPRRVRMLPDGGMPAPPFELVDNQQTWLDQTDLVFIDPVGTGFSRPAKKDLGKKFWSLEGDIASVGDFIRLYITRYQRWNSPLFLVGESYGTTRAAGLSGYLINRGIALNGVVLVSSVLNFETLSFSVGNDLPYILFLPTYTATAWYHKKLPADLQQKDLPSVLAEVQQYAAGPYTLALGRGDSLASQERDELINNVSRYTGLDRTMVDVHNARIDEGVFTNELLRNQKLQVGRLDSRFTAPPADGRAAGGYYDPSESAIRPPFTAAFNNYVRTELGFKTDLEYYVLGGGVGRWEWGSAAQGYPDTSEALRLAFIKNPYMKLFVASGYYDLATPFFATRYTLNHMGLDAQQQAKISLGYYDAGHMMYIKESSLDRLKQDVSGFLGKALQ
jgi:carboxypeptidase C (cathepsin A)